MTDRIVGVIEPRKKRKLNIQMDDKLAGTEQNSETGPTRRHSREEIFDLVDELDDGQSDYEDENDSMYGDETQAKDEERNMSRNGGVAIELDPESQHALDAQAQIQAELFPRVDSVLAEGDAEINHDHSRLEMEEDTELMEIDADTFNAACEKTTLQRENKQLRRQLEKAERKMRILYPLVKVGMQIRQRHLEHIGARFGVRKDQAIIQSGNQAAHEANTLADIAMMEELGAAGARYIQVCKAIYQDIWSSRHISQWGDIPWDDRSYELRNILASCRQENVDEKFLQPHLGALFRRIKEVAASVGTPLRVLECPAQRAKINSDGEVIRLCGVLRGFLKHNVGNNKPKLKQRPAA